MIQPLASSYTINDGIQAFQQFKQIEGRMRRTLQDYERVFHHFLQAVDDISLSELNVTHL